VVHDGKWVVQIYGSEGRPGSNPAECAEEVDHGLPLALEGSASFNRRQFPGLSSTRLRMVPVGEQCAQCREQDEGLVQHGVMPRFGDLDDWCDPAQFVVHRSPDVGGDEAMFGPE